MSWRCNAKPKAVKAGASLPKKKREISPLSEVSTLWMGLAERDKCWRFARAAQQTHRALHLHLGPAIATVSWRSRNIKTATARQTGSCSSPGSYLKQRPEADSYRERLKTRKPVVVPLAILLAPAIKGSAICWAGSALVAFNNLQWVLAFWTICFSYSATLRQQVPQSNYSLGKEVSSYTHFEHAIV